MTLACTGAPWLTKPPHGVVARAEPGSAIAVAMATVQPVIRTERMADKVVAAGSLPPGPARSCAGISGGCPQPKRLRPPDDKDPEMGGDPDPDASRAPGGRQGSRRGPR
jgi:hypothetical protein